MSQPCLAACDMCRRRSQAFACQLAPANSPTHSPCGTCSFRRRDSVLRQGPPPLIHGGLWRRMRGCRVRHRCRDTRAGARWCGDGLSCAAACPGRRGIRRTRNRQGTGARRLGLGRLAVRPLGGALLDQGGPGPLHVLLRFDPPPGFGPGPVPNYAGAPRLGCVVRCAAAGLRARGPRAAHCVRGHRPDRVSMLARAGFAGADIHLGCGAPGRLVLRAGRDSRRCHGDCGQAGGWRPAWLGAVQYCTSGPAAVKLPFDNNQVDTDCYLHVRRAYAHT